MPTLVAHLQGKGGQFRYRWVACCPPTVPRPSAFRHASSRAIRASLEGYPQAPPAAAPTGVSTALRLAVAAPASARSRGWCSRDLRANQFPRPWGNPPCRCMCMLAARGSCIGFWVGRPGPVQTLCCSFSRGVVFVGLEFEEPEIPRFGTGSPNWPKTSQSWRLRSRFTGF